MKVAILDIDSKIPNLALMKISAAAKGSGWGVDFFRFSRTAYPRKSKPSIIYFDGSDYDRVYASIIFTTNKEVLSVLNCNDVSIGGSGYDLKKKLPEHIDGLPPDYTLYPQCKHDYGFITRGCIRNCYFCFVPRKEGKLKSYASVNSIVSGLHNSVVFMDNNILAYKRHKDIFEEILDRKLKITFNQGLDIRLLDEENVKLLSKMNYMGEYIFAFDDIGSKAIVGEKYKLARRYIKPDWKIKFFIYCHPTKTPLDSIKKRIVWCKENKALPYIMRDFSCYTDKNSNFYTDIASWCNQPGLFKNMQFKDFLKKRVNTKKREARSNALYYLFCG